MLGFVGGIFFALYLNKTEQACESQDKCVSRSSGSGAKQSYNNPQPSSAMERVNCFSFPLILVANAHQIWNDTSKMIETSGCSKKPMF